MIQIIMAIAMLCQVKPIKLMSAEQVDQYQLTCQQEYFKCVLKKKLGSTALGECLLERKIKQTKKGKK